MIQRLPGSIEFDDLVAAGVIGLIEASEKYEGGKGVSFISYSKFRIKGAMIDELRKCDWMNRSQRRRSNEFKGAIKILERRYGKKPSDEDLMEYLEIDRDEINDIRVTDSFELELLFDEVTNPDIEIISAEDLAIKNNMIELIEDRLNLLPEQQRELLLLRYRDGMRLKDIGEHFGFTESRACQVHSAALKALREICVDKEKEESL